MKYREFMNNLQKKLFKWNYAIPIGIIAHIIYRLMEPLGGIIASIGVAIGAFGILIFIGLISGFLDLAKFIVKKIRGKTE